VVANVWDAETSKVRKDLDAAAYKNIAALAKRFDGAYTKFSQGIDKKDKAKDGFDKVSGDLDKIDKQLTDLMKDLSGLGDAASATVKTKSGDSADDVMAAWEEHLKACQAQTKESKACCDQLSKMNESYDKHRRRCDQQVPDADGCGQVGPDQFEQRTECARRADSKRSAQLRGRCDQAGQA
jgi:exonuclease V gamma subunit